jgi:hypothetical protein
MNIENKSKMLARGLPHRIDAAGLRLPDETGLVK